MTGDRLDNDRTIRELRDSIDAIDQQRAVLMASWIVSTVVKVERTQIQDLDRDEARLHWQPYNVIQLLTSRRDRRTDLVGVRKKEIEERYGEPIPVNQEGRWQSVKHTYVHAIAEECENWQMPKEESYVAIEWMHNYTEYEHLRAKKRQAELIERKQQRVRAAYINVATPSNQEFVPKVHNKFPWQLIGHRSPDHKKSA